MGRVLRGYRICNVPNKHNSMKRFLLATLFLASTMLPVYAQMGSFGIGAAIAEDVVLVGQIKEDDVGKVFIFTQDPDEGWQRTGEFSASDGHEGDLFGYFVKVHEGLVYVGAPSMEAGEGAIYIFGRDAETGEFAEMGTIMGSAEDHIGGSAVITAEMVITGSLTGASHLSVFERNGDAWERTGAVSAEGVDGESGFGMSVAMDDDRLYVGAPGAHDGAGAVHVFSRPDYTHEAMLTASDSTLAALGVSLLAMNDGTVFAGAPGIRPNSRAMAPPPTGGAVQFGQGEDGTWMELSTMTGNSDSQFDLYGFGMAAYGDRLYVGAALENQFQGVVYEYAQDEMGAWMVHDTLAAEGSQFFGMLLHISAAQALVTAPLSNRGVGSAYVFTSTEDGWALEGTLESGEEPPPPPVPETAGIDMVPSEGPSDCADSLAWQFGCSQVDLLAFLPLQSVGGSEGVTASDIWGWTDPETGSEYALLGRSDGTAFVDITDPANPVYLGSLAMTEGTRSAPWRDIKVYSDHAFIVADGAGSHGMQVFDLTQLRGVEEMPATFEATARYDGIHSAHNIVINEDTGFAYAVGSNMGGETCGGGLHMINIQDPLNPTFAGCFSHEGTGGSGTGYSHDAQCVTYHGPDAEHANKEICLGSNANALSIADVTDKDNPVALSSADYPKVSYTHQGWLTDDHRFFYMNDELDELSGEIVGTRTLIWDLADLDDPLLVSEYLSDNKSSDHNLYIMGDVMYQSNYKSGLRIFDISDRVNPVLMGFFDTFPGGEDSPGFNGSWSNYPYFESGSIIVSSMGEGLFVLKRQSLDI